MSSSVGHSKQAKNQRDEDKQFFNEVCALVRNHTGCGIIQAKKMVNGMVRARVKHKDMLNYAEDYRKLHMEIYLQQLENEHTPLDRALSNADALTVAWFEHHGRYQDE